jgi:hypothetical protein
VEHLYIAKDDPTYRRAKVGNNFATAVSSAEAEARRQWTDLSKKLKEEYGDKRGSLMACMLTHDNPAKDCYKLTLSYTGKVNQKLSHGPQDDGTGGTFSFSEEQGATIKASVPLNAVEGIDNQYTGSDIANVSDPVFTENETFENRLLVLTEDQLRCTGVATSTLTGSNPGAFNVDNLTEVTQGTTITDYQLTYSFDPSPTLRYTHSDQCLTPAFPPVITSGGEPIAGDFLPGHPNSGSSITVTGWQISPDPSDALILARKDIPYADEYNTNTERYEVVLKIPGESQ